ncbi:MAG: translation initiation factor IF-2 [Candidatus Magnetoovum sp. WYHC-5]|nr:translation initiation factor IF-2 [Candidatus Magnetoovum sp. WYHC-5]
MAEIRIYEFAKKLNISSKSILDALHDMGIEGKRPASGLSPDLASKVETFLSEKKKTIKKVDVVRDTPDNVQEKAQVTTPASSFDNKDRPSDGKTQHGYKGQQQYQPRDNQDSKKQQYTPQNRPQYNSQNRPQYNSQNRPQYNSQNRPQGTQQNRPQYNSQNNSQNRPQYNPQNRPQGTQQNRPQGNLQNRPQGTQQNRPQGTQQNRPQRDHYTSNNKGQRPPHRDHPYQKDQHRPVSRDQHNSTARREQPSYNKDDSRKRVAQQPQTAQQRPHTAHKERPVRPLPSVALVETTPKEIPTYADEDIAILDRFKRKVEIDKVDKLKPKLGMQRAFQSIRKVEPKKVFDTRYTKKSTKNKMQQKGSPTVATKVILPTAPRRKVIKVQEGTTVNEFAKTIGQKLPEVIKKFMELGSMVSINQPVDMDAAILVADSFGTKIELATVEDFEVEEADVVEGHLKSRPPVITIMGHVDHGKTSLLDAIRSTKVQEKEAGGITQHIGAYKIKLKGKEIVFLDTPGHEAFTSMRARGAKVTDIVVLVIAADDGVMPQTLEAISHAMAANVAIVVAINKIDKSGADVARVKNELAEHGVVPEDWGGKNIFVEVSAKKRIGIEELLEMIILQAELMDLRANPDTAARGIIIESKMDKNRGAIATVLIQNGTLNIGDVFIAGLNYGRVRALSDDDGNKIISAGPATPVEVLGFSDVPNAGELLTVVDDEKRARQIAITRLSKVTASKAVVGRKLNLDDVYAKIKEQEIKELNIIVKGDVQGSVEAVKGSMDGIKHEEVKVRVIHTAIGGINESDVMLASASNAIILGFNVRADVKAQRLAEREGVDVRFYNVIYDAIDDIKKALEGMLEPTIKETILGTAEVRQLFVISRLGTIAGCMVTDGVIQRASEGIRVIRDNIVVHDGKINSLKRVKDDVKEVNTGYECGIMLENYNDIKIGDILENYKIEKIASKL